jgi:hypothetical protein
MKNTNIPKEYKPLSMWGYFGYSILYSIPFIGLLFMIIFALSDKNINRRNYTRSFFLSFFIVVIFIIVLVVTGAITSLAEYHIQNQ